MEKKMTEQETRELEAKSKWLERLTSGQVIKKNNEITFYRNAEIVRSDGEKRTIEVSFSSEVPVDRWFGNEILKHDNSSVRLQRLNSGGAFLVDHHMSDMVGVVERAWIGDDRKGRAIVRLGKNARANEIFNDITDGIRKNMSVGYQVYKLTLVSESENVKTYEATDWEPLEISSVSVPADISVGVGRSLSINPGNTKTSDATEAKTVNVIINNERENKMEEKERLERELKKKEAKEASDRAVADVRKVEKTRIDEIYAMGKRHNLKAEADKAIEDGASVDAFRAIALEKLANTPLNTGKKEKEGGIPVSLGERMQAAAVVGGVKMSGLSQNVQRAISGMSTSVGSDGGFLVGTDTSKEILKRTYETGVLAAKCQKIPIGDNADGYEAPYLDETSRANGSRLGGIQVYRAAEADAVTATKPKLGKFEIRLEDMKGLLYMTERSLKDTVSLEASVKEWFAEEFGFKIDAEIVDGTGAGMMLGLLRSSATVVISEETDQPITTINYENIQNMWARMWARSRQNAVWYINQDVEPQLNAMTKVVGTGGVPVYLPANGLAEKPYSTLMGRPVIPIEQCKTLGTKGDIILADLSQYLIIDKGGLQSSESVHVRFIYDEMTFKFTYRVNGRPKWLSKLTPLNGNNTLSPTVVIEDRT